MPLIRRPENKLNALRIFSSRRIVQQLNCFRMHAGIFQIQN